MATDYIPRDALLRERHSCTRDCAACDFATDGDSWCKGELFVVDVLRIPAADVVERKRGEWVGYPESFKFEHIYDRDAIVCPFCEVSWNIVDNDTEGFNFCPNCGADLREDNNAKL